MKTEIDGYTIDYEIKNKELLGSNNPLIIFLHEGLGSRHQWKDFPAMLNEHKKLPMLFYSRVGYGKSDFWKKGIPENFLRYDAFTTLPLLIKELGITNKIILFGHSDGATIALLAASIPLTNLLGIISEAPHVIIEDRSIGGILSARKLLQNPDLLKKMNQYQNGRAAQLIEAWSSFWLNPIHRLWEMKQELEKIHCPVLLIQGEDDNFGTFKQLDAIKLHIKSKIIKELRINHCGHIPHREKMDKVAEACLEFVKNL